MTINIQNLTINARFQWLVNLILRLNDKLGTPITFVLKGKLTVNGTWTINSTEPEETSVRAFNNLLLNALLPHTATPVFLSLKK